MPTYRIECLECGASYDQRLSFTEYDNLKAKNTTLLCKSCGQDANIVFSPGKVSFILKEGASGGWVSKSLKENAYRSRRREIMAKRERDHVFKPKLQPNFDGAEAPTWKDAQEQARQERGDEAAATYDPLVKQEQLTT